MQKRLVVLASTLVCTLLPLVANAASWSLNTWVKSSGGTISVRGDAPQTSFNGSVFKTYTTSQTFAVTVSPNTGYNISQVNYNNVVTNNPSQTSYDVHGPTTQTVHATFVPQQRTVNATAGSGGSVNITNISGITYGTILYAPKKFTYTPNPTYNVASITGVPAGATVSPSVPAPANTPVTVTLPVGYTITTNIGLHGTFAGLPIAKITAPQTVLAGTPITLSGSTSTGTITTYTWNQTSGPGYPGTKVIADNSTGTQTPSIIPSVAGTYTFSLSVAGTSTSTATATVTVINSLTTAVQNQCQNCHSANGVGINVFSNWSGSVHKAVVCATCHVGADTGGHPGTRPVCANCHTPKHTYQGASTATSTCVGCHSPSGEAHGISLAAGAPTGAPHFNNITGGMYPASYNTLNQTCANCHVNGDAANKTIRKQWAKSGHADTTALPWIDYDFKTRTDGCVRCHTTTGFIAYSSAKMTAAWGVATDKTKEVLTCVGCHSDITNGTVRTVTPNKPFADEASYTNRNVGPSNICMDCHSGRNNGTSIQVKVGSANFSNLSYIAPHYLTAGGTLHGKSGYQFPGRTYADYSGSSHRKIGMTNTNTTGTDGPCVACHMSAPNKHAFKAASSASGAIASITTTICTNCHNASMPAATLDAKKVEFNSALEILKIELQDKGFAYSPNYPYFASKNWGSGQSGANVMGAAFNYKLFVAEPGAYTHYPLYAKQLIVDSIDAVFNNGTVTGSIDAALNDLYGKGKITVEQMNSLNSYKNPESSCGSCHGNPPATPTHIVNNVTPGTCSNCHIYSGPAGATHNNGTLDMSLSCTSCHGNPPSVLTVAKSGHTGIHTTATDCATCHGANPGAAGHNNGVLSTTCVACHGFPPATVAGGAAHSIRTDCATCHGVNAGANANHKNGSVDTTCVACHGNPPTTQTIHTTGAVQYTHSTQNVVYTDCTVCHDSTHRNGTVDLITNQNACSSCHGYPPASGVHSAATTSPFNCTNCHDYTGYTGPTHNNGTVNTLGLTCDTCHGYPPLSAAQLGARASGEFVNAKLEDYASGGGYHASHLSPTLTASQGFTPCLPCHPSAYHSQGGGSVVRDNVNIFDAADTSYRLNTGLPKTYDTTATTCNNVSCHFKASPAWKL